MTDTTVNAPPLADLITAYARACRTKDVPEINEARNAVDARIAELEDENADLHARLTRAVTLPDRLINAWSHRLDAIHADVRKLLPPKPARPALTAPMCIEPVGPLGAHCGEGVGEAGFLRLRCDAHLAATEPADAPDTACCEHHRERPPGQCDGACETCETCESADAPAAAATTGGEAQA